MAIKIFAALMGLFSLVLVFLSTQDFYFIEIKPYGIDFKNVEAKDLSVYELNTSLVKTHYQALTWIRYENEDIFDKVQIFGFDYNLSTDILSINEKEALLQGGVVYEDSNQTRIEAQSLFYDKKTKDLSTKTDFKAYRALSVLSGESLHYNIENKELNIKGVKAWLQTK